MNERSNIITDKEKVQELLDRAFAEDVKTGDVTTNAIVDEKTKAVAVWISKQSGIVAGLDIARMVFQRLDNQLEWKVKCRDGDEIRPKTKIVAIRGSCRAILTAERIALNFVQRMSGIATKTNEYVNAVSGFPAQILDTRKTVPGLRLLDKYAVSAGGGTNHRMGLYDLAMVKDNHIIAAGSIEKAVTKIRNVHPDLTIEVETTTLDQVKKALGAGADIIMLDNMNTKQMKEAVTLIDGNAETEASGNITLQNVRDVAQTGVDYISAGALTHSVQAFDISQQLQKIVK